MEVFLPDSSSNSSSSSSSSSDCGPDEWLFFIHGGAWGSGLPWFYRLVAVPFVRRGMAVAIIGYRTYPSCGRVQEQVQDCLAAAQYLSRQYSPKQKVTVLGHSSGAHVAMLLVVELAMMQMRHDAAVSNRTPTASVGGESSGASMHVNRNDCCFHVHSFVGISGPYDISHHFDYEAARGVEELSPMKPVCGYTREAFRINSPAVKLQSIFLDDYYFDESTTPVGSFLPVRMALVHGMEDDTVPFTATAEAARVLRTCGVHQLQEIYIAHTGHQDTIMQLMLGGRTQEAVLEWMESSATPSSDTRNAILKVTSKL
jgi:acetyl esterase/lipase